MWTRASAWLKNIGLQRQIQLLTAVGLLAIFGFFWLAGQRAIEESTRQSLENQLTIATLVASSLDHRLNTALTLLQATAAQPELNQSDPDARNAALREAQLRLSAYGQRLLLLDDGGMVLWTDPLDPSLLSQPYPNFDRVQSSLGVNPQSVSNLCRPPDSSSSYVLLTVPILTTPPEGEGQEVVSGFLVEEVPAEQLGLQEVLSRIAPDTDSYIEVVDYEGMVLAASLPALCLEKGDHADQFTRLIDSHQPTVGTCHQCHPGNGEQQISRTEEVLAFAPLSAAPWGVAVRRPADQVMAPVRYLRRQVLLGGGAALIATWLVTWFIARQIVGPIQSLDKASAQFAAGNLRVPIPERGVGEVARLAANMEQMRVRLETTLEDHRRWNEALEEMVEERTRELSTLYEQLQGREAMCKRLLGKVLTAQEEERARLARELHDTIGQSLTAIIMTTTAVESSLPTAFASGKEKLTQVRDIAAQALRDLRNLIFDLRPEVLDDLGLALALRSQIKKYLEPLGVKAQLRASGLKDQLPAEVETAVFRVVQEAITNIARHAQATEAHISLTRKDDRLIVRVEDNGIGFDPALVMEEGQKAWGLRGMEERITLLGGKFYIGSKPGQGTLVLAEVPLEQSPEKLPEE